MFKNLCFELNLVFVKVKNEILNEFSNEIK